MLKLFLLSCSVGTAGLRSETEEKVALTSEIKNPFTLLSHLFGGWPREKQLFDWQWKGETESETQKTESETDRQERKKVNSER